MKTDINEEMSNFFKEHKLDEITKENIKKYFNDINKINEYGGLLHAAVQNKFPEDKVLKFIDTLLQCGVDVNLKGKSTGYSFIHLALYGYTENGEDYSYSTEFINKLISLAKKYNFDVNIKDNDGDSLIHTALASEVYTGDTANLIDALGDEYDLQCKDNNDNNIYEALIGYKQEASQTKNKIWYDRLSQEREKIKSYIEKNNEKVKENIQTTEETIEDTKDLQTIEEDIEDEDQILIVDLEDKEKIQKEESKENQLNNIIKQENIDYETINQLKTRIEAMLLNITIEFLLLNYATILNDKNKLNTYLENNDLSIREKSSIILLSNKLDLLLKETINNYIIENQTIENVDRLKAMLIAFNYEDELQLLNEIIKESSEEISIDDINECKTLRDMNSLKEEIENIQNEDIKKTLLKELNKKEILFIEQIESIKLKINVINSVNSMNIVKDDKKIEIFDELDYAYLTVDEINSLEDKLIEKKEKNKNIFWETINNKIVELLNLVSNGEKSGLLTGEEIWNFVDSKLTDNKKQAEKVRTYRNEKK